MLRASLAVAGVVFLLLGPKPAGAQYYTQAPWCAVVSTGGDVRWECIYRSIEECRPNVLAGNRWVCDTDPYFVPSYLAVGSKQTRRARPPAAGGWVICLLP